MANEKKLFGSKQKRSVSFAATNTVEFRETFGKIFGRTTAADEAIRTVKEAAGVVAARNNAIKELMSSMVSPAKEQLKQMQELFASTSPVPGHAEALEAFKREAARATGALDFPKEAVRQQIEIGPALYRPRTPKFVPRDFANERIEKIYTDKQKAEEGLPIGKAIRILISFAKQEIEVVNLKARDSELIDVNGYCNGEDVSLSIHYQHLEVLFPPYNLPGTENQVVH